MKREVTTGRAPRAPFFFSFPPKSKYPVSPYTKAPDSPAVFVARTIILPWEMPGAAQTSGSLTGITAVLARCYEAGADIVSAHMTPTPDYAPTAEARRRGTESPEVHARLGHPAAAAGSYCLGFAPVSGAFLSLISTSSGRRNIQYGNTDSSNALGNGNRGPLGGGNVPPNAAAPSSMKPTVTNDNTIAAPAITRNSDFADTTNEAPGYGNSIGYARCNNFAE